MNSKKFSALVFLLCVISVWGFGSAAYIHAKAELAQYLVEQAWTAQLSRQKNHPGSKIEHKHITPWPWADTWPVAQLKFSRQNRDYIVLAGATGSTLAFGPGWMKASAMPGSQGVSVVAAHRDTHFSVLRDLRLGDEIVINTLQGDVVYRVIDRTIVDSQTHRLNLTSSQHQLLLVTCYPFDAMSSGGSLRYVVTTEKINESTSI